MRLLLLLLSMLVFAFSSEVYAGSAVGTLSLESNGGFVSVSASGAKTNNPACSTSTPQFTFERDSDVAATMETILLAAQAASRSVTLVGSGTCVGGTEILISIVD
jgi:hypothetical protein